MATGVESWGPAAFARRLRTHLGGMRVAADPELRALHPGTNWARAPRSWNVILFGPSGAGKSSLIFTMWRALVGQREDQFTAHSQQSMLRQLRVGWTLKEAQELAAAREEEGEAGATAAPPPAPPATTQHRHGTSSFQSFAVRQPSAAAGGIVFHDTKGQTFFDEEEAEMVDLLRRGELREGSTADERHYRYWLRLGQLGIWSKVSTATTPHAVVLVFDVSLRSFTSMVNFRVDADGAVQGNDALHCYRKVIQQAQVFGHEVFVALTHADVLEEREETVGPLVERLAQAMDMPEDHIYCLENYRAAKFEPDPQVDLRALEFLETVLMAADRYAAANVGGGGGGAGAGKCVVS